MNPNDRRRDRAAKQDRAIRLWHHNTGRRFVINPANAAMLADQGVDLDRLLAEGVIEITTPPPVTPDDTPVHSEG